MISIADGTLRAQFGGEEPLATVATSPSTFVIVEKDLELRFTSDEGGGPDQLTSHASGRVMHFRRVPDEGPR